MRSLDADPWSTLLASTTTTVRKYAEWVRQSDKSAIAEMIHTRFKERYLDPIKDSPARHGFAMLAISCLMVEALESFRNGWKDTSENGKSGGAFCSFFHAHDEFSDLRPVAHEFYRAVRCGILHQAETTQQWRVNRERGLLLAEKGGVRWLSAYEFGIRLGTVLDRYRDELKTQEWTSPLWINARKKLQTICKNCGVPDLSVLS